MNIKAEYMLRADLAVLHYETIQWMGDLRFYVDEFQAFKRLIGRKKLHNDIDHQIHKDIHHLTLIHIDRLLSLLEETAQHEKYLSDLMRYKADEDSYRERHKRLAERINRTDNDLKTLKMEIYTFLITKRHKQRHGFPI